MRRSGLTALQTSVLTAPPARARGPNPWRMDNSLDRGMWLWPCGVIAVLVLLSGTSVALVRWIGGRGSKRIRTARDNQEDREARGEIGHEEYLQRRADNGRGR